MYLYCQVQKCQAVWPAICLLQVILQYTYIVRCRGGTEISGGMASHLSVAGDTAIYRYFEVQMGVQKCQVVRSATCLLKVILQCTDIVRFSGWYRNVKQYGRPPVC
jgi:hypothetical protein